VFIPTFSANAMANTCFSFTPAHLMPLICGDLLAFPDLTMRSGGLSRDVRFNPGRTVLGPEILASTVWILTSGSANVSFSTDSGQRISRAACGNEVFGLTEVLAHEPYCVTLETRTSCRFKRISETNIRLCLASKNGLPVRLLTELSERYLAVHKLLSQKILL
jgi:CRP-like cAMP-binding protein